MGYWLPFRPLIPFFIFILLILLPSLSSAFRDLGIPVRDARLWGVFAGPGKTGLRDTIYLSFGQYGAPLFLLAVNPDTGETRQFNGPLPSEMGSWGFTTDSENRIYLGSYYHAHLLRFDPKAEKWDDLGQPGGEKESFICSLSTGPDGKIWGGTYPSANLFSYDPKTGVSEHFGRMDPEQLYCYPTAGEDGLIYCAIQFEKRNIVVFNPRSKYKKNLVPAEEMRPGRIHLIKGEDRKIYARLSPPDQWFLIEGGERLVRKSQTEVPMPQKHLLDGRSFHLVDPRRLRISHPLTKEEKEVPISYEASGSFIFVVGAGPDGRVYGSSMLPLRLFVYDSEKDSLNNLGKASQADGEIYSMGVLDGKLYLCSYPEARLSIYDPKKPTRFGEGEDDNPRDVGPFGDDQYRPRAMVAGPQGKVYVGSFPDYGHRGGAISVYDPVKKVKRVFRHIVPNQSIASLASIERLNLLAAGSSIHGGTGTQAIEKEAKLILWDPKEEKKIFEITPVPDAKTILSLASTDDGILYGITDNEKVFVFDSETKEMKKVLDLEFKKPIATSLHLGPSRKLYGLSSETVFVVDPKDDRISFLGKSPVPIHSGMAILGLKIYFGSGAHLWEFEIPLDPPKPTE